MEVTDAGATAPRSERFVVHDATQVGEARRGALAAADRMRLGESATGRLAVVATELGTNLAKHAREGALIVRPVLEHPAHPGVEVLALDCGPGIPDAAAALRDGFSTGGTRGAGLGAVARMADVFDVHSQPSGTAIVARVWGPAGAPTTAHARILRVGAVNVAAPREQVSGDAWAVWQREGRALVAVADGLGHGPEAAEAAEAAMAVVEAHRELGPGELVERMHLALRATRGAAVAVCELEQLTRRARFAGIGNISASLLVGSGSRSLTSHTGIVGHQVRKVQEFTYEWPADTLLLLHSDGIATRWRLDQYPGLIARQPSLVAGVLYRDFVRGRDDATVVALREAHRGTSASRTRD